MNIALTGTPGTGKTSLSSKLDYNLVSINDYYSEISNGKDKEDNWLPAPEGPFYTVLRIYGPDESVLNGAYKLPEIIGVQKN